MNTQQTQRKRNQVKRRVVKRHQRLQLNLELKRQQPIKAKLNLTITAATAAVAATADPLTVELAEAVPPVTADHQQVVTVDPQVQLVQPMAELAAALEMAELAA